MLKGNDDRHLGCVIVVVAFWLIIGLALELFYG
jgi:hypothetical protein